MYRLAIELDVPSRSVPRTSAPGRGSILVVYTDSGSGAERDAITATLEASGLRTLVAQGAASAFDMLASDDATDVIIAPTEALELLRAGDAARGIPTIEIIDESREPAGADDYVRRPVCGEELVARVRQQLRLRSYERELQQKHRDVNVTLELTQTLASSLDFREILLTVVRRIAQIVAVDRVSIVLAPEPESGNVGYVVAASDDERITNLRLDLTKYPELQEVLRTGRPLRIDDASTHPLMDEVREDLAALRHSALTLVPIVWEEHAIGALFLRAAASRGPLSERELGFCRIVAGTTAVALRNARMMQSLRDRTQQVTFERFEAERRLEAMKRYADLFESAQDGIAVVDMNGVLLFANPKAYELAGYPNDSLRGEKLQMLLSPDEAERIKEVWAGFAHGVYPKSRDLRLRRRDDQELVGSVSFAPLHEGDAVLILFRDVTEERRVQAEFQRTRRFLESLVDASADGIVAADMKGNILVFNKGAERIYGYSAADAIARVNVRELYPENTAAKVMEMIRSSSHGGAGKLTNARIDARGAKGEHIPIALSGGMIYEDGREAGTFGIFTDLREKLNVEERLARAQQKLAVTEKQMLIAELAGTAAHELNQPLTSVMGYAELMKRKLDRSSSEHQAADIIVREAERMAEIVRKIGKITKYETKSYVGQQRILDLDRAIEAEDSGEPE